MVSNVVCVERERVLTSVSNLLGRRLLVLWLRDRSGTGGEKESVRFCGVMGTRRGRAGGSDDATHASILPLTKSVACSTYAKNFIQQMR